MITYNICLTVAEWEDVLDELSHAGVSFYEIYGQVEDLVFGYEGDIYNYEWLEITASGEAFEELAYIFDKLGLVTNFD